MVESTDILCTYGDWLSHTADLYITVNFVGKVSNFNVMK